MTELAIWTQSRARLWRECKYKHYLMYVDGWRPVRHSEALHIGILFHLGLEQWWGMLKLSQDDPEAFADTFTEEDGSPTPRLKVMLVQALQAVAGRAYTPLLQIHVEEMLIGYHQRWKGTIDEYEVLSVEQQWSTAMVNPQTGAKSRTWVLGGKWDVIARHRAQGKTVIIEHKTCGEDIEDPVADYWAKLRIDNQVSQYYVGALELGYEIDGVLYDVYRKPATKHRAIKQVRKRKAETDAEFEARKAVEGRQETDDEYRVRVRENLAEKPERHAQRRFVDRTEADLDEFAWDTWEESKICHESTQRGRAPRNPNSCALFGTCIFWDHCANGAPLEGDDRFEKVEWVHPELDKEKVTA